MVQVSSRFAGVGGAVGRARCRCSFLFRDNVIQMTLNVMNITVKELLQNTDGSRQRMDDVRRGGHRGRYPKRRLLLRGEHRSLVRKAVFVPMKSQPAGKAKIRCRCGLIAEGGTSTGANGEYTPNVPANGKIVPNSLPIR